MAELDLVSQLDLPPMVGELKSNGFLFQSPDFAKKVLLTQAYNFGYYQDPQLRFCFGVDLTKAPHRQSRAKILMLNMLDPPTSARLYDETADLWNITQQVTAAEASLGFLQLGWGKQRAEVLRRGVKFYTKDWLAIQHEVLRAGPCKLFVSIESVRQSARVTTPRGSIKYVEFWYDQLEFLDGSYAYFTVEGPKLEAPVDYTCIGWEESAEKPMPYAGELAGVKPLGKMH
jgi:hypothetical protein